MECVRRRRSCLAFTLLSAYALGVTLFALLRNTKFHVSVSSPDDFQRPMEGRRKDVCGIHSYSPAGREYREPSFNILTHLGIEDIRMPHCTPRQSVSFLKTHKTAGSVLATMLFRYMMERDLNVLMAPRVTFQYKGSHTCAPDEFTQGEAQAPPYNLIANHAMFMPAFSRKFMPPDMAMVTVLRHPVPRFVSAWSYFEVGKRFNLSPNMTLQEQISFFLSNSRNLNSFSSTSMIFNHQYHLLVGAGRCFDGQTPRSIESVKYFLEHEFGMVLVQERLDESLVLLQHEMCWSLSDIISMDQKVTGAADDATAWLTQDQIHSIEAVTRQDKELWNFANQLLDRKLDALPPCGEECERVPLCVEKHVAALRAAREAVTKFCAGKGPMVPSGEAAMWCERATWDTIPWLRHAKHQVAASYGPPMNEGPPEVKSIYQNYDPVHHVDLDELSVRGMPYLLKTAQTNFEREAEGMDDYCEWKARKIAEGAALQRAENLEKAAHQH